MTLFKQSTHSNRLRIQKTFDFRLPGALAKLCVSSFCSTKQNLNGEPHGQRRDSEIDIPDLPLFYLRHFLYIKKKLPLYKANWRGLTLSHFHPICCSYRLLNMKMKLFHWVRARDLTLSHSRTTQAIVNILQVTLWRKWHTQRRLWIDITRSKGPG